MKLDRNINQDGSGKYALILMRHLRDVQQNSPDDLLKLIDNALDLLERNGIIDYGSKPDTDFFVIRLKDRYAFGALASYAKTALINGDIEYGNEVMELANIALEHPNKQQPT